MDMPKDMAVLDPRTVESRAEILMAMDVLMNHLNEQKYWEDEQTCWLAEKLMDGAPPLRMTQEQLDYYSQFVDDFDYITGVFARMVRRVCFKTTYEPDGFC